MVHNWNMERRKIFLVILFSLIILSPLWAGEMKEIETEHFRIIFTEDSRNMAQEIYENAENSYAFLVSFFGEDPDLFLPVYINEEEKVFNAYFTQFPYNRIVVFNAPIDPSLDNGRSPIALTFLHELTHAFTYSFKGKLGDFLVSVFGDWANFPPSLHMLSFLSEGIAVYMESRGGEGRLNDPFFYSDLAAAKGEEISYLDASGGRDIKPGANMWYSYGGPFIKWVRDRYGEKDLSSFYLKLSKNLFSFPQNGYSSVFGSTLWNDWNAFMDEYTSAFSGIEVGKEYSDSRVYRDLVVHSGTVYGLSPSREAVVRFNGGEEEKVFSFYSSSSDLVISEKGEFLLPCSYGEKSYLVLIDENGKEINRFEGFSSGAFLLSHILALKTEDRLSYLVLMDREGNEMDRVELGYNVVVHEAVTFGDSVYFLLSQGGRERIAHVSPSLTITLIESEEDIVFSSLSAFSEGLSFSWKRKGEDTQYPKYGEYLISEERMELYSLSVEGGINYPVRLGDAVWSVQDHFDYASLSTVSLEELGEKEEVKVERRVFVPLEAPDSTSLMALSTPYSFSSTMKKGVIMPIFENTGLFLGSSSLGLTWFTMDASESMDMLFSLGLEDLDSFLFGASTRLDSFTLSLLGRVDSGVFSSEADLAFSYTLPLFHMGQSLDFNDTLGLIWNGKMSLHNYFEVLYSDKRHSEMGRYHLRGWSLLFSLTDQYPFLECDIHIPHILPSEYGKALDWSLSSTFYVSTDISKLGFGFLSHLLTLEVQNSFRFLSLYLSHLDLYGRADYSIEYRGGFSQSYTLGLTAFLSPQIGVMSRSVMEMGGEIHYNPDSGIKFSLVARTAL